MTRALLLAVLALASAAPAHADPSERSDRDRVWHAVPFVVGGTAYLVVELALKSKIARLACWWCEPTRVDRGIRSALKWDNVERAASVSNVTGFFAAPALAIGGLVATTAFDEKNDSRRTYDDLTPVLQAGIVAGVINETIRILVPRRRPYAHFKGRDVLGRPGEHHMSFFSGHTALAFAMATSAGTVASLRDYDTAPVLWGGGLALAFVTSYLRIAADAHYATDVLTGAVIGSVVGVAIPLLFHRDVLTDEPATPRVQTRTRPVIISIGSRF